MTLTAEMLAELELLSLFPQDSLQEGIKVHSSADTERIAAVERLFAKGLVTQLDGGYLTQTGLEAVRHLGALKMILSAS